MATFTELDLASLEPTAAMRPAGFSCRYYQTHPQSLRFLNTENLHKARILKTSPEIRAMHSPLVGLVGEILRHGQAAGLVRRDVGQCSLERTVHTRR